MSQFEIRPRFQRQSRLPKEEVLIRLREALQSSTASVRGLIVDHHITLSIPSEEQHFWSPQLSLEVEEEEGGSLIRGLYGPRPAVWLLFIFFYAILGFLSMVITIIGLSERSLGLSGRILWLLPVAGFILLMVYLGARTGQRLGHDEIRRLQRFMEETLREG